MANKNTHLLLCFLVLLASSNVVFSLEDCLYTIRVKTADRGDAGTDAKVSIRLGNNKNDRLDIPDIVRWGVMPSGHDYFEKGNLDSFSVQARCLASPICFLRVSHDNTGKKPGWYLSYVEASVVGTQISKHWNINQWLALDEPPYSLSVTKDDCPFSDEHLEMPI